MRQKTDNPGVAPEILVQPCGQNIEDTLGAPPTVQSYWYGRARQYLSRSAAQRHRALWLHGASARQRSGFSDPRGASAVRLFEPTRTIPAPTRSGARGARPVLSMVANASSARAPRARRVGRSDQGSSRGLNQLGRVRVEPAHHRRQGEVLLAGLLRCGHCGRE